MQLYVSSTQVMFLPPNSNELGDVKILNYICQAGERSYYPVCDDASEERSGYIITGGSQNITMTTDRYKDSVTITWTLNTRRYRS